MSWFDNKEILSDNVRYIYEIWVLTVEWIDKARMLNSFQHCVNILYGFEKSFGGFGLRSPQQSTGLYVMTCECSRTGWHCGNVLDSYARHTRFEYPLGHPIFWNFCDFPQSLHENSGTVPRLGHHRFLPNHFQFTTNLSSHYSTLINLVTGSIVKWPTKNRFCPIFPPEEGNISNLQNVVFFRKTTVETIDPSTGIPRRYCRFGSRSPQ
jgi:hypothetical protein